ncbi:GNAT family N-acetyltransferase [Thalassococcus sp. S3]|uniref:GNAT family N-acetyltransferase n=1 Tax=Thalassococcus sp. S3 TaxID=2017482 RepID=UPI0010248DA0|nr:GNAT family N-acetyltransferase [Thalassococcus sp. S3]QBF32655.1 GNAT family N-acetyltransferase [Thalassococcus sp. S3]
MDVSELEAVLTWAAEEGWNPGLADAAGFHAADQEGFFLTRVDGVPVASVSVVNHDPENAFLGLYLCHPDWRGQGLGLQTWQVAIAHAGSRSIGLDGVPEQEHNYRRSGFTKTGSSLRHEGRLDGRPSPNVRSAAPTDTEFLINLDARANGYARRAFLNAWLQQKEDVRGTRVYLRDREICGFATWRQCQIGTKIGPLIAPDLSASIELISDIAALRPDGPLIIDTPEGNGALRRELELNGFSIPFVTARMFRGAIPDTDATLQAIATMELG